MPTDADARAFEETLARRENEDAAREASEPIIPIPEDQLQRGIGNYSEDDRRNLTWLFHWASTAPVVKSRRHLCEMLGYDWTTLTRVANGAYPDRERGGSSAAIAPFMAAVRDLRRRVLAETNAGFVRTTVTDKIQALCDYAFEGDLRGGHMAMIVGPTGRSKTESVLHWAETHADASPLYIDCPDTGTYPDLIREVGKACRVLRKGRQPIAEIRAKIIECLDRKRPLIFDEVFRLLPSGRNAVPKTFEFIRRLRDVRGCPVILVVTPVLDHDIRSGGLQAYFEQLLGRIEPLYIPEKTRRDECRQICQAFAQEDQVSRELVDRALQIANEPGRLRVLFSLMARAANLARRKKEPLALKHLAAAHDHRLNRNRWIQDEA